MWHDFIYTYIRRAKNLRVVTTGAFCILALLTLLAVFPIVNHKESAEAAYAPATSTLAIASNKDTASVDIKPNSSNGTFVMSEASDMAEFSVTTDNLTGYSVTLLGSDTSGQLINTTTGDTLDTITADTTESDFRNGSANDYSNKWGYRLNVNSTTTTDFMAAPTTAAAKFIYSTNEPNTDVDTYKLALGARIDYEKSSGTYTNTFILTAVGNPISYQINYLDKYDGTSILLEQDANSNITASGFTISAANPTRTGFIFDGWCYGSVDYTTDPSTCGGTPGDVYQAGDSFAFTSIPSIGTAEANLYAMWERELPEMQNLDSTLCTATPRRVVDARDSKTYTVARLADGQCWMTSNLNLAGGTELYSETSDVPDGYPESGGTPYFELPESSTTFEHDSDMRAYVYNTGNETTDQADCNTSPGCNSYYSWLTATAGGKTTNGAVIGGSTNGRYVAYSICPKGWRLPKSGSKDVANTSVYGYGYKKGDFYKLAIQYGMKTDTYSQDAPYFNNQAGPGTIPNFLFAGGYSSSVFYNGGSAGVYWSSSFHGNTAGENWAYTLRMLTYPTVSVAYSYATNSGASVRCVMIENTMQDFTSDDSASMAIGDSTDLIDIRDRSVYRVAKLDDGNVWMVQDLNFVGTPNGSDGSGIISLSPDTSNVSTNVTFNYAKLSGSGGNSLNEARISGGNGHAWYNYSAATVMSVTGSSNASDAVYDICPKGWRLPTYSEQNAILSYKSQYDPGYDIYGSGMYYHDGNSATGVYWWSSTAVDDTNRWSLTYNNTRTALVNQNDTTPEYGFYVRCIKENRTLDDISNLQDINPNIIKNTANGTSKTLNDVRDNQQYLVSKLNDGKIWMLDNLRLGFATLVQGLSATNTNMIATSYTLPASSDGFTEANVASPKINTSQVDVVAPSTSHGLGSGKVGVYYNYCAASAGTYCVTMSPGSNDNASHDLCPAAWRMPTGGEHGELGNLYASYSSDVTAFEDAFSTVKSGIYNGSGTEVPGTVYTWTSTNSGSFTNAMYYLFISASDVVQFPGDGYRQVGMPMRCVAK